MASSTPIPIPISSRSIHRNSSGTNLSKSYPSYQSLNSSPLPNLSQSPVNLSSQSPLQSPLQSSSQPQSQSLPLKRVVLYGTPFKNKGTISMLLQDSIKNISEEYVNELIKDSETKGYISLETSNEKEAFQYCQNLVENGLDATIE